jgi:hypothetical protein
MLMWLQNFFNIDSWKFNKSMVKCTEEQKQSLSLMSTDVMGVFGEVSKVVPLWHSFKHGPHGKML